MDIEKAFKFWWSSRYLNSQHIRQAKNAFIAGATWQREQLEAEILNKEKSWYTEFPDEKSAQDVFNIIKDLQAESIKWTHTAQYRLSQHLQSKLDKAVEIIKIIKENVIHYAVTEEEQHLAYKIEQFLSSLDKPKEK